MFLQSCTIALLLFSSVLCDEHEDRYLIQNQCLEALQQQINDELHASLTYLNMAAHFHGSAIGRKGFFRFFEKQSDDEKQHAHKLIHYISKRGGRVNAFNVAMPTKASWASAEEAVRDAVDLEKELNVKLHNIHKNAERICADPHLMDFLESEFLEEQVASIRQLSRTLTILTSFEKENRAMGEFMVDQQLAEEDTRKYYVDEL